MKFGRTSGYRVQRMWTVDLPVAARGICELAGFRPAKVQNAHLFGHDLEGQTWRLEL